MKPDREVPAISAQTNKNRYEYVLTNWWSEEEMTITRRTRIEAPVAVAAAEFTERIANPEPSFSRRFDSLFVGARAAFARLLKGSPSPEAAVSSSR